MARAPGTAVILLAAGLAGGCAVGRSAGRSVAAGAVERLTDEDSALVVLEAQLADSAGAFLGREFADAVLDPARTTWAGMRRDARRDVDSMAVDLEHQVRTGMNGAVATLLTDNADLADARIRQMARGLAEEFMRALGEGAVTQLAPAGDTLVREMLRSAVVGMETDLRPALHTLMTEVRDSLRSRIGDVDRAVAGSRTVSGLRYALFGAGGILLIAMALLGTSHWRRRTRALHALIDAIEAGGHEQTKRAVQTCTRQAGVHTWLDDWVRKRTGKQSAGGPEPGCE